MDTDQKEDKLKVVFVPRRSRIRPYKIAKALKLTGKVHLVLVCEESFYDKDLLDDIFDEVHFFTKRNVLFKLPKAEKIYRRINQRFGFGFKKMLRIIKSVDPDLIHCFAEPYNHIAYILKNTNYPVIMSDGADFTGITAGIENLDKRTAALEKYCFENVAGIIYKGPDLVTDYYRNIGYKIHGKELSWFDHTDVDLFQSCNSKKRSSEDGCIHLVYTGNISTNSEVSYCYYIPLAKILSQLKIHLHIYPNPWQYSSSREYIELSNSDPYFHFHQSLPMIDLIKEISRYDLGLWIHSEMESSRTSSIKMKTGMVNKMFTYLEAGLPVIVSESREFGVKLIESESIGFKIKDEEWVQLSNILNKLNMLDLKRQVEQKRKKFSLQERKGILYKFYQDIIESK